MKNGPCPDTGAHLMFVDALGIVKSVIGVVGVQQRQRSSRDNVMNVTITISRHVDVREGSSGNHHHQCWRSERMGKPDGVYLLLPWATSLSTPYEAHGVSRVVNVREL